MVVIVAETTIPRLNRTVAAEEATSISATMVIIRMATQATEMVAVTTTVAATEDTTKMVVATANAMTTQATTDLVQATITAATIITQTVATIPDPPTITAAAVVEVGPDPPCRQCLAAEVVAAE